MRSLLLLIGLVAVAAAGSAGGRLNKQQPPPPPPSSPGNALAIVLPAYDFKSAYDGAVALVDAVKEGSKAAADPTYMHALWTDWSQEWSVTATLFTIVIGPLLLLIAGRRLLDAGRARVIGKPIPG